MIRLDAMLKRLDQLTLRIVQIDITLSSTCQRRLKKVVLRWRQSINEDRALGRVRDICRYCTIFRVVGVPRRGDVAVFG